MALLFNILGVDISSTNSQSLNGYKLYCRMIYELLC